MNFDMSLFILALILSAYISTLIGILALRKREIPESKYYCLLVFAFAFWMLSYAVEIAVLSMGAFDLSLVFFYKLKYCAIVFIPVFWILFTLQYTRRTKYITMRNIFLLCIIPAATLLIIATNSYHYLFFTADTYMIESIGMLHITHGIWYRVFNAFIYLAFIAGFIILTVSALKVKATDMKRIILLLITIMCVVICNAFYTLFTDSIYEFDLTPILFVFVSLVVYFSMFVYPEDTKLTAKKKVISIMKNGIFILNMKGRIVEYNPAGKRFAVLVSGDRSVRLIGEDISKIFTGIGSIIDSNTECKGVIPYVCNNESYFFEVECKHIVTEGKISGKLVIFTDISKYRHYIRGLTESKDNLKVLYNNISDGVLLHTGIFAEGGRILDINDVIVNMSGMTREAFLSQTPAEVRAGLSFNPNPQINLFPEKMLTYNSKAEITDSSQKFQMSFRTMLKRADGSEMPVMITTRKYSSVDGSPLYISLVHDLTDEDRMHRIEEKSLAQIEENIEVLSILNDHIRNPLMIMSGMCSLGEGCPKDGGIMDEIVNIDGIVKSLDLRCTESADIRKHLMRRHGVMDEVSDVLDPNADSSVNRVSQ